MRKESIMTRRVLVALTCVALAWLGLTSEVRAADKLKVAASFSVLGDMVNQVGGDRVDVVTFVGPNGDAHVYEPTPGDIKELTASKLLFVNGLGLGGWMERLEKSSGFKGTVGGADKGIKPRQMV